MRRFIPNFVEIVKPISYMLKKGHDLKWSDEAKKDFENIKHALCHSLILVSPNYQKDFHIFSFASNSTMVVVLFSEK
jgi:hypothetical protein